ncbi:Crp/Fnr family transcriptional regulator [Listeria newyorkensis]|uniref:Crp/Fnr family transcriptional regulator n=1 Tax=Listeria newyorkensis TaxID=1497681 RepID=A0A841YZC8_9LIST|nr:Crp/Fnr family transcriptional regulator [Listeria newyorkensis]MBC1458780.1 Crp/Fnr family transcriptional regulator [Listeria newyorkensis]
MQSRMMDMDSLYSEASIISHFSERRFRRFIEEDRIFPVRGVKKTFNRNDIIFKASNDLNAIYFIDEGIVTGTIEKGVVVDFYTVRDVLGLSNLMLGSDSAYTYQVLSEELVVTRYAKEDIIEKVMNTQEGYFYHYVHMQNLVKRMVKKEELLRLPTLQRISSVLLELGEKYGEETSEKNIISFPRHISKGMIAQYANLNPNTITSVLQKLQEEGFIYTIKSAIFMDKSKLEMKLEVFS